MSARCSNSPSLSLTIGSSRVRRVLHGLLCLLTIISLYRLSQRGYPLLTLLLVPLATLCCWRLARQRMVDASISWRQGEWALGLGSSHIPVSIRPGSTCLPWVIYLAWCEAGRARCGSVFLFPDSAAPDQLRQLRVRLTLER